MALPPVERVARFQLDHLFAPGAVGPIYLATHELTRTQVALRLLDAPGLADPARRGHLDRELGLAALMKHPNLVPIVDQGTCPASGVRYVAYELPPAGRSAWDLIEERGGAPLEARDAAAIGLGVAEALRTLEAVGIVHRHITPFGVLVGEDGLTRVVDVGVGRLVEPEHATAYTAPEQAAGGAVDHRADLYSLGACLFLLLTGHEPPGRGAGIANRLGHVVMALCAREPDARYASAALVARDLELVLAGGRPLGPSVRST